VTILVNVGANYQSLSRLDRHDDVAAHSITKKIGTPNKVPLIPYNRAPFTAICNSHLPIFSTPKTSPRLALFVKLLSLFSAHV
jgi:hypothetical protein